MTTNRPTPEQIADEFGSDGRNTIARLDHHGYRIVHPDDLPELQMKRRKDSWSDAQYWYAAGEEAHHTAIFKEDA